MEKLRKFCTYNAYGKKLEVIEGILQERYGPHIFCHGGLIIQAADIKVPNEDGIRTVYLKVPDA